jgi:hypothetical protein
LSEFRITTFLIVQIQHSLAFATLLSIFMGTYYIGFCLPCARDFILMLYAERNAGEPGEADQYQHVASVKLFKPSNLAYSFACDIFTWHHIP